MVLASIRFEMGRMIVRYVHKVVIAHLPPFIRLTNAQQGSNAEELYDWSSESPAKGLETATIRGAEGTPMGWSVTILCLPLQR